MIGYGKCPAMLADTPYPLLLHAARRYAMPPPSDGDRKILLDYLAAAFPARAPRGWQNPFQK